MLGCSCSLSTSKYVIFFQDALFFLKDFFSNLASSVNPYLPVDPAAEGELCVVLSSFRLNPVHFCLALSTLRDRSTLISIFSEGRPLTEDI